MDSHSGTSPGSFWDRLEASVGSGLLQRCKAGSAQTPQKLQQSHSTPVDFSRGNLMSQHKPGDLGGFELPECSMVDLH